MNRIKNCISLEKTKITNDNFFNNLIKYSFLLSVFCGIFLIYFYLNFKNSFLYNYLAFYYLGLSVVLGNIIFLLIQHATRCGWSLVLRRISESFLPVIILLFFLFLPVLFNLDSIYSWNIIKEDDVNLINKSSYLNKNFFILRYLIYFFIWFFISYFFYNNSIKQDSDKSERHSLRMWAKSPLFILLFALTLTFSSFDWIMSLQPHWYSTIFGVYCFSSCFLLSIISIILVSNLLYYKGYLINVITVEHLHDLGKYLFGFVIFFAYIAYSQFMLYWYANIPEEIEFYLHRMHGDFKIISWIFCFTNFFVPFFMLLSRNIKRNRILLIICAFYVMFSQILNIFWLVLPIYSIHLSYIDYFIGVLNFVFIFSSIISFYFFIFSKNHIICVNDSRLNKSIKFENF